MQFQRCYGSARSNRQVPGERWATSTPVLPGLVMLGAIHLGHTLTYTVCVCRSHHPEAQARVASR